MKEIHFQAFTKLIKKRKHTRSWCTRAGEYDAYRLDGVRLLPLSELDASVEGSAILCHLQVWIPTLSTRLPILEEQGYVDNVQGGMDEQI